MRIGIVVPTFERPEYLADMLDSLLQSNFPPEHTVIVTIIDDASKDTRVRKLLQQFLLHEDRHMRVYVIYKPKRTGMWNSLRHGFNMLIEEDCDLLMNIDSDMRLKKNWLQEVIRLHKLYPHLIVTGFDADSHSSHRSGEGYRRKKTVGGANLVFNVTTYTQYIAPSFKELHWDNLMCKIYKGNDFICAFPSVMQHEGKISTVGHRNGDKSTSYESDDNI